MNNRVGVLIEGAVQCNLVDSRIESNGWDGEKIGLSGAQTAEVHGMNVYLLSATQCLVHRNFFEQSDAVTNSVQVALTTGSYENDVGYNVFANHVGAHLHSSTDAVWGNKFHHNQFAPLANPNFVTTTAAGGTYPNGNWLDQNIGLNWSDDGGRYDANIVNAGMTQDGRALTIVPVSGGAGYTPDGGLTTGTGTYVDGTPKGRVIKLTLDQACLIGLPTNFKSGEALHFIFIQNGTGGYNVTWNAAFKTAWADTGNTANKRSTISFLFDGTNWNQVGAQSPYLT